jgi:hypothetical protein
LSTARRHLILCALGALALAAPAAAEVADNPADSLPQAYGPLQPGVSVSGEFKSPNDVDYLSFTVTAPNTAVHFKVTNTLSSCSSPDGPIGCAVFGTLIDGNQQQLGGEGSSAGTGEVDAGRSDVIDWTVANPGTYYLAMDSGGSFPTYRVVMGSPAPTGKPIESLSAQSVHHGTAVRVRVKAGRPLRSLKAKLTMTRHGTPIAIGRASGTNVKKGFKTLTITVNRTGRTALAKAANHRLRVRLRVTALPAVGRPTTAQRSLTLHR